MSKIKQRKFDLIGQIVMNIGCRNMRLLGSVLLLFFQRHSYSIKAAISFVNNGTSIFSTVLNAFQTVIANWLELNFNFYLIIDKEYLPYSSV